MCERIGCFPGDDMGNQSWIVTLRILAADWSFCYRTARFVAECVVTQCPQCEYNSFVAAVEFVVNELLENAVKFGADSNVLLAVGIANDDLICLVENRMDASKAPSLRNELMALACGDPGELLRHRVEQNVQHGGKSGLGFLSIMHDYQACVGWRLTPDSLGTVLIQTMASLPINQYERKD